MARVQPQEFSIRTDISQTGFEYVGFANIGNSNRVNDRVWKIMQIEKLASGDIVRWAGGTMDYNKIWNNRYSLIYS